MSARDIPRLACCSSCGAPLVAQPARADETPIALRARRIIAAEVDGCPEDCWRFLAACWPDDPWKGLWSEKTLAEALAVMPTTFSSRFFRAALPSASRYIRWARLVVAASCLDQGMTWSKAALDVNASSPQALHRTLRREWGVPSTKLRELGAEWALEKYVDTLIRPHAATLRRFRPLAVIGKRGLRLVAA